MPPRVILIYPELGFVGSYVVSPPISLVYAAARIASMDSITVEIIDCRIEPLWRKTITDRLKGTDVLLVGISVMSGIQVVNAVEISRLVKGIGNIPIVWGGPHPTILPMETLAIPEVDFCVRGFGASVLKELVDALLTGTVATLANKGLGRKTSGAPYIGDISDTFEPLRYHEIPYWLLDPFIEKYFQFTNERAFPIYTASGCPYQCAFCISPVWYKNIRKKWIPYSAIDVVDHIEHLVSAYRVHSVYFFDDDTFVKISHFTDIARELIRRGLNVTIGVRGIRVNELMKMSPDDFTLLQGVGGRTIHVGLESGSQRMLDLMKKGITVEESLEVNRRLAKYPRLIPMYNILCGFPTETVEDVKETGRFMLRIADENPGSIMFAPGKLIPYPGSALYAFAQEHGFKAPKKIEEWSTLDQEADIYMPWYTPEYNKQIKILQVTSYAISNWESYFTDRPLYLRLLYMACKIIYRPLARFRLKTGYAGLFFEDRLFTVAKSMLTLL